MREVQLTAVTKPARGRAGVQTQASAPGPALLAVTPDASLGAIPLFFLSIPPLDSPS